MLARISFSTSNLDGARVAPNRGIRLGRDPVPLHGSPRRVIMVVGIVTRETVRPMSPSCRRLTSNRAPTVRSWGRPRTGWQRRHPRFNARWLERGGRTHRRNASGRQIDRRSSVLHKTIALALDHQGGDAYRGTMTTRAAANNDGINHACRFSPGPCWRCSTLWSPRLTLRRRRGCTGSAPEPDAPKGWRSGRIHLAVAAGRVGRRNRMHQRCRIDHRVPWPWPAR